MRFVLSSLRCCTSLAPCDRRRRRFSDSWRQLSFLWRDTRALHFAATTLQSAGSRPQHHVARVDNLTGTQKLPAYFVSQTLLRPFVVATLVMVIPSSSQPLLRYTCLFHASIRYCGVRSGLHLVLFYFFHNFLRLVTNRAVFCVHRNIKQSWYE